MKITQKPYGLFVLKRLKGMKSIHVTRNKEFRLTKMKDKLIKFYETHLIQELIDSRHSRTMQIRNSIKYDIIGYETLIEEKFDSIEKHNQKENKMKNNHIIDLTDEEKKFTTENKDTTNNNSTPKQVPFDLNRLKMIKNIKYLLTDLDIDDFINLMESSSNGYCSDLVRSIPSIA